jgi:proteasome lid subunit RPN8/RPN11
MKKIFQTNRTFQPKRPTLRFTPTAWAKLLFLRDAGDTEIGGFGITSAGDLLMVEDFALVLQACTATHVDFEDSSVADYFDAQVDAGRQPQEFSRIWIHTHPGVSAEPSQVDEQTFERVFGSTDWAVMFILARGGQSFARLRYNLGPGADFDLRVEVDFGQSFTGSNEKVWQLEYEQFVRPKTLSPPTEHRLLPTTRIGKTDDWYELWDEYVGAFESNSETIDDHHDDF